LQLFSLRGKYDDIDGGSEKHPKTQSSTADKPVSIVKQTSSSATSITSTNSNDAATTSTPIIASENAGAISIEHSEVPEPPTKSEEITAPTSIEQVDTSEVQASLSNSIASSLVISAAEPAPALVKPLVVPPKPVPSSSVSTSKPAPQTSSSASSPKVVYGGNLGKCASCSKTVYPADSHVSTDGLVFHTQCFKCSHCKSQLTLTTLAQIKGIPYCKTHFIELFKLRGKYDDIAPVNAGAE
jgi:LIM domain